MKQQDVIDFFNRCAPWWDEDTVRDEQIISTILDNGGIKQGVDVLDVACGTGVLFGDYLKRGVSSVTGIDIADKMAQIAASKYPEVKVICGDVEKAVFDQKFDCVMVYNAFPHFPDPERLVAALAKLVKPGGKLSVAHGMSRADLLRHHSGIARSVSIELLPEQELAEIFSRWFDVDVVISNERMYQVSGIRRSSGV
ncbi:MAG: class I SAM-dependent methyltransferase [Oscillospiraceae bacterium]|nr:class I SAM-dependent methyltransferase [Oscillospiraceae bacterium]